ncbi:MAG: hypothetical protein PVH18_09375 [Chloroflexota bacterium]|jgi:hypothetical protein
MNRSQAIGGFVCLAIAALLAVLSVTLPADKMIFMIGDTNAPIIPAIVLAVVGVALVVAARSHHDEDADELPVEKTKEEQLKAEEKKALNGRLEAMGWGLFLIMVGGLALIPDEQIPNGVWSIGVGIIMLGLNAARYYYGIKLSGFTTVLGLLAVLGGIAQLMGLDDLDGAFLFIILGAYLLLKPWFDKRGIFGKPGGE